MRNKEILKRRGHGAALSVSSECVKVILFGGRIPPGVSTTAVLEFSMS